MRQTEAQTLTDMERQIQRETRTAREIDKDTRDKAQRETENPETGS